tara:strand:+ start:422 stop:4771 length:4350 start_codon:yes stop_codon:yes gene_type:complete
MANREIWKFNKFGGINSYSNPKDLKSDEFVVMDDCNVSQKGIINTIGKMKESSEMPPGLLFASDTTTQADMYPGKGLYNYFSDYTYAPINESHISVSQTITTEASDGTKAYMLLDPCVQASSCLLWLFDAQPTGGRLRLNVKVNGVNIHKQVDGTSDTYLTVMDTYIDPGSGVNSWYDFGSERVNEIKNINPSNLAYVTNISGYEDGINLFNSGTYANYERVNDNDNFVMQCAGDPYDNLDYNSVYNSYDSLGSNTVGGNFWEALSTSSWTVDLSLVDNYEQLPYNHPNTRTPVDDRIESYDYGSYEGGFWDNSPSPGTATGENYHGYNDNRWIWGKNINNSSYYGIGYHRHEGLANLEGSALNLETEQNHFDDIFGAHESGFNAFFSRIDYPRANLTNSSGFAGAGSYLVDYWLYSIHTSMSLWMWIIRAINAYAGTDATDKFTAWWSQYDYEKYPNNDVNEDLNDAKHFTNTLSDTIYIEADTVGTALNNKRLTLHPSANSLQDGVNLINETTPTWVDTTADIYGAVAGDSDSDWSMNNTTGSDNVFLRRSDIEKFHTGELIKIDSEVMYIKSREKFSPNNPAMSDIFRLRVERADDANHWLRAWYGGGALATHSEGANIFKYKIHPFLLDSFSDESEGDEDKWRLQHGEAYGQPGDPYFTGGTATAALVTQLAFSGPNNSNDTVTVSISGANQSASSIPEATTDGGITTPGFTHTMPFNGNLAADVELLRIALNACAGITVTRSSTNLIFTSGTQGTDGNFTLTATIVPNLISGTIQVPQGVNEELTTMITKSGHNIVSEDTLNAMTEEFNIDWDFANVIYRYTGFQIFSSYAGLWSIPVQNMSGMLNWYYTDNEDNNPIMWDEGSKLRVNEGNYNLHNKGKIYGYFDLSNWFKGDNVTAWGGWENEGLDTTSTFNYNIPGLYMVNNSKTWKYTCGVIADDPDGSTFGAENIGPGGEMDYWLNTTGSNGGLWQATHPSFHSLYNFNGAPAMRLHFERTAADSGGIDWQGTCKFYAAAVYDDGGDGLPAHQFTIGDTAAANIGNFTLEFGETDADEETYGEPNGQTLRIFAAIRPMLNGQLCFPDERIIGIRLYYTHSDEHFETFWSLGMIDFRRGFDKANEVLTTDQENTTSDIIVWRDVLTSEKDLTSQGAGNPDEVLEGNTLLLYNPNTAKHYVEFIGMPKIDTFESINGYSPYNETLNVRYKAHCIGGRRSFVGNIVVPDVNGEPTYYNDRMVVSPVNQLDTFPYPHNVLDLDVSDGDEIVALRSVGERLLQFKRNILYMVNIASNTPSEFYVEERHKFKGVLNLNHITETDKGLFWVNKFGAYLYDGEEIKEANIKDDDDKSQKLLDENQWESFITDNALVGYNPKSKECFVVKNHTQTYKSDGDCFIYNLISETWTYGKFRFYVGSNAKISNFIHVGDSSKLCYITNNPGKKVPDNSVIPT